MKPITIHPVSFLLGLALSGLAFLATSAQMGTSTTPNGLAQQDAVLVKVVGGQLETRDADFNPRNAVVIREGEPFTVPDGNLLVLTALGATEPASSVFLRVNGVRELRATSYYERIAASSGCFTEAPGNGTSLKLIPPGCVAQAGSTVEVLGGTGDKTDDARAWGYLVDA